MLKMPSLLNRRRLLATSAVAGATIAAVLAVWCGRAISAQDKYAVKVPNGLAFAEFRGYELWQVVSISHDGPLIAAILGNPAMIEAYQSGIPGNGQPFPDGVKLAKIHWNPTEDGEFPRGAGSGQPT